MAMPPPSPLPHLCMTAKNYNQGEFKRTLIPGGAFIIFTLEMPYKPPTPNINIKQTEQICNYRRPKDDQEKTACKRGVGWSGVGIC